MYTLIDNNGIVNFMLKVGSRFVKHQMSLHRAQNIIASGKQQKKLFDNYPINIDNTWHFEGKRNKANSNVALDVPIDVTEPNYTEENE